MGPLLCKDGERYVHEEDYLPKTNEQSLLSSQYQANLIQPARVSNIPQAS